VRSSPAVASPLRRSAGKVCQSTASSWGAALPPHRPGIACRFPNRHPNRDHLLALT
jgi:hypothetical protein